MRRPALAGNQPKREKTLRLSKPSFLVAALLMSAAFNVLGQGSIFPKGTGTARSPDGGDPRGRRPDAPDYRQYEYGKEVYAVKLGCRSCPLGEKPLDESTARRFLSDDSLWAGLDIKEEAAVKTYLRQLYTLQ